MEITQPEEVTHALLEKSESRTLDEIRDYGADQVRVIRPADVTAMISEGVDRLLRENHVMSDEDLELLVEKGPKEFRRVARERELDRQRAEQEFQSVQQDLQTAHERIAELEQTLGAGNAGGATPAPAGTAAPPDASNMEFMMNMMTEMAGMKAQLAQAQAAPAAAPAAGGGADGIADALGQISANLNQRLEQMGKKMGISSAVEAKDVDFGRMFDQDDSVDESNMGDVEVKKKTGGGIAGNLARLKKLKGGD